MGSAFLVFLCFCGVGSGFVATGYTFDFDFDAESLPFLSTDLDLEFYGDLETGALDFSLSAFAALTSVFFLGGILTNLF